MKACTGRTLALSLIALAVAEAALPAEPEPTIGSLENRTVQIPPAKAMARSTDKARETYRLLLETVSDDAGLRAEAMRRLADLELEASEAAQLSEPGDGQAYGDAVDLFRQLLETWPDHRRNDTVLYQLARAYELGGQGEEALRVLNELVERYPATDLLAEVQFRRGEMLFLRKDYSAAEAAYQEVVNAGDQSRYHEQSLYKLGWARFKQGLHEESHDPFFALLDRKIGEQIGEETGNSQPVADDHDDDGHDGDHDNDRLASLARAERELVEDALRVLSIGFSYMEGPESISAYLQHRGRPAYGWLMYKTLGDLYLEQERYVDAAGAYEAFVRQERYHPKAPLLQVAVIEAYEHGAFPTLVLESKQQFVERYGMDSPFWQRHPRERHAAAEQHLKAHLNDLAQHYHAAAQKNGEQADYRQAARWYRKYLEWFPGEPGSASTHFLLAEILFESRDYGAATQEYERTAYDYPRHEHSSEAGYAAILSYRRHEESLTGAARAEWHGRYRDSALKFADSYPEHAEAGRVLTTVAEDLFRDGQYDRAITVAEAAVSLQPPIERPLARTAWTVIAHSRFDLGHFTEAEGAYYELRPLTPADDRAARASVRERIASSIYKQGELARDGGDLESAVGHFMRLGTVVPDSAIRETAEYDAAAALVNLQAWVRAADVLETHRRDYPGSAYAGEVTQKLAVSYLESGRNAAAAGEFERIADSRDGSDELRREALWRAAKLYREEGETAREEQVLVAFVERYPDPVSESIEARLRLLEIAEAGQDADLRMARLRAIVSADRRAGSQRSDRTRYLAATASLQLAEPLHRRFLSARITQPLAASLKRKKARMEEVLEAYGKSADYGIAEVTTAATYRLGQVYQQFGRDLMDSERPADLDADALEQYELLLEEQAFPFEEEAIGLFEANVARAAEGIYDEWVQRSFAALARLVPARYAKLEQSEDVVTALY